jgi:hypothetical protein
MRTSYFVLPVKRRRSCFVSCRYRLPGKAAKGFPAYAPAGDSEHPEYMVYRCCLPALTGFASFRRPETNAQHARRESYRCLPGTRKKRQDTGATAARQVRLRGFWISNSVRPPHQYQTTDLTDDNGNPRIKPRVQLRLVVEGIRQDDEQVIHKNNTQAQQHADRRLLAM